MASRRSFVDSVGEIGRGGGVAIDVKVSTIIKVKIITINVYEKDWDRHI
jgi:hypothetical protein